MSISVKPLTFSAVDELGFAAAAGHLNGAQAPAQYEPKSLGPVLELHNMVGAGRVPRAVNRWLVANGAAPMLNALQERRELWVSPDNRRLGFIRAVRAKPDADSRLTAFLMDAQRAARDVARLPGHSPGQLVAAMEELENNIHEHSDAADTGILAFRAAPGMFEFVAADRGIGVLASLRKCTKFTPLTDHGKALASALADGTSRFDERGRGNGFRPIFIGLVNLRGSLRFRSGDHALLMDGASPKLATAQLAQKPAIDGFLASICCRTNKVVTSRIGQKNVVVPAPN
jgi:hypothetical protein